MSKPLKIVGVVLTVAAVVAAVTGVAFLSTRYETQEAEPGLYVNDKRVEDPGVILTAGDDEIGFEEYRYYYLMNKSYMEMFYGEEAWTQDYDGSNELNLRKQTDDSIEEMYAWLAVAQEEGIELSEEEKAEVQNTMAEQKEELGEEGFAKNLASMFLADEEMYVRVTEMQKLSQKAQEQIKERMSDEVGEVEPDTSELLTAKHILIAFDEEAEDYEADQEAALTQANELRERLREAEGGAAPAAAEDADGQEAPEEGEGADAPAEEAEGEEAPPEETEEPDASPEEVDATPEIDLEVLFDQLVEEFGEDPGMEENPGGYTFQEGEMVEEFYEGTLALKEGEISEPIRTDYGYHIIMRLPLDEEYLAENAESMKDEQVQEKVDEFLEAYKEKRPLGYGEYYAEISPQNVR